MKRIRLKGREADGGGGGGRVSEEGGEKLFNATSSDLFHRVDEPFHPEKRERERGSASW